MIGLDDLEDDIELPPAVETIGHEKPRKLSRLRKGGDAATDHIDNVQGIDTPEGDGRSSMPSQMLADDDHESTDEDDEETNNDKEEEEEPNDDTHDQKQEEPESDLEKGDGAPNENYWDEEDEIEQYFAKKSVRVGDGTGHESTDSEGSDSEEDGDYEAPVALGDNPSLEDLNKETQRILRDTAARDRLGRGQKIEIKPLTGIIEKLRQRRALAISRAPRPQPNTISAPGLSFDDIIGTAIQSTIPHTPTVPAPAGTADGSAGNEEHHAIPPGGGTADTDLEFLTDGEGDGFHIIDLPSTKKAKPSPLAFNPYNSASEEVEEFEEQPLIDDGLNDDNDASDSESDRSWEVKNDGGVEAGEEVDMGPEAESDIESEENDFEEEEGGKQVQKSTAAGEPRDGNVADNPPKDVVADTPQAAFAALFAQSDVVPKNVQKMQRTYLDMEAELSDEEGAGAPVSDDEDEDNINDNGELKDLITKDKVDAKDQEAAGELHNQWEKQRDAKELQNVLRGLKNGFRRGHRMGAFEGNGQLHGRLRRARVEDDDDENFSGADFNWPSAFTAGGGDEEEGYEDEAMLHRAKQQRLLAESQNRSQAYTALTGNVIPMDEDSQAVLGLMARSASEGQQGGGSIIAPPPSRLAMELLGSEPGNALLHRGPSFVGRQSSVARTQSTGGLGLGGGRSFIFGRSENSNSALGMPGEASANNNSAEGTGPVNFANLRHMVGLDGGAGKGREGGGPRGAGAQKRDRGTSTLVSRLKNKSSMSANGSQESLAAVSAVCKHALAPAPTHRRR